MEKTLICSIFAFLKVLRQHETLPIHQTIQNLTTLEKNPFENDWEKNKMCL